MAGPPKIIAPGRLFPIGNASVHSLAGRSYHNRSDSSVAAIDSLTNAFKIGGASGIVVAAVHAADKNFRRVILRLIGYRPSAGIVMFHLTFPACGSSSNANVRPRGAKDNGCRVLPGRVKRPVTGALSVLNTRSSTLFQSMSFV